MTENVTTFLSSFSLNTPLTSEKQVQGGRFSWGFELTLIVIGIMLIIWNLVALLAINHSQRTPKPVRFFSSALISFEVSSLTAFTLSKFKAQTSFYIISSLTGSYFLLLSFATVCLMSAERLVVFSSKRIIIQNRHFRTVWRSSVTIWLILTMFYYGTIYADCEVIIKCIPTMEIIFGIIISSTLLISIACYIRVYYLIIYASPEGIRGQLPRQRLRATGLVFMYLVVSVAVFFCFVVNAVIQSDIETRRIQADILNIINCVIDPLLHVWWFKECQIKLLYFPALFCPSIRKKIETLKYSVFDIVTYRKDLDHKVGSI